MGVRWLSFLVFVLATATALASGSDGFDFVRKFHPAERVLKETTDPIARRTPSGSRILTYSYQWVRVFTFRSVSPELLGALRQRVARSEGQVWDAPGKGMTVRLPNGREGYFDYKRRELRFEGEPDPGKVQKSPPPFAADIAKFQAEDRKNPPAPGQILFIGSSTFTNWTDVGAYFPRYKILNRAFGGSTLLDQIRYVKEVVFPYRPKQIVIYCGENDFAADLTLSPDTVSGRFLTLYRLIRGRLREVPIMYVSMKPSPSRWNLREKFKAANRRIEEFCKGQRRLVFVSVWDAMLNPNGTPRAEIFRPDKLHMNADGYKIWQPLLERVLVR